MEKLIVLIAAAGQGKRMGLGFNKVLARLGDVPLLVKNLQAVACVENLDRALIIVGEGEQKQVEELLQHYSSSFFPRLAWQIVIGGKERQDSVAKALATLPEKTGWVAVHDGARPFATPKLFQRVWLAAKDTGAAIAAVPCKDTVKVVDNLGNVTSTLDRSTLMAVQTPQIFRLELLRKAYAELAKHPHLVTDDAGLVEEIGARVATVLGSYENIKITTPEDLKMWGEQCMQVGSGYDVHKLVPDRKLILCGVNIPSPLGLEGHSDADVALHAIMDALLGAAGLGDIGKLFPDTDMTFKDADSRILLRTVITRLTELGWRVNNVDVTIIAQGPKLAAYREKMKENLMEDLNLKSFQVNVKATTTEHLGFTGRGEGMAAEAVATIIK